MLQCSDATYYTGITTDVERRVYEHNNTKKGAKYTRFRRPVKLVYEEKFPDKSSALKEEYKIKRLSRKEKIHLIKQQDTYKESF
jgi:putative endonuclease